MDRTKLIEAILNTYRTFETDEKLGLVREALKRIGDANLCALAADLGINTEVPS